MISLGECVDVEVLGRSPNSVAAEILVVPTQIADVGVVVIQISVYSTNSIVVYAFDSQNSISAIEIGDDDDFVVQIYVVSVDGI